MQDIKNFKSYTPDAELIDKYKQSDGKLPLFLISEDGQDWYECQSNFSDDTVKVLYNDSGVIVGLVDAPVPHRGNIYAVSVFFPSDLSVAEISVADLPAGCCIDGKWHYESGLITKINENVFLQSTRKTPQQLALDAYILQCAVDAGTATEEQISQLAALKQVIAASV